MSTNKKAEKAITNLVDRIRACSICTDLPLGPRPLLQVDPAARILIAGQAPGRKTHVKGVPFDDASGDRLRSWMGVDRQTFYNEKKIAILPMGFCYPGTGKSGDLPPRAECEPAWREAILEKLPNIKTTLVIGQYALRWHLGTARKDNLTKTVQAWQSYWPELLPLPHPSPRNIRWFMQNPWFDAQVIPALREHVQLVLS